MSCSSLDLQVSSREAASSRLHVSRSSFSSSKSNSIYSSSSYRIFKFSNTLLSPSLISASYFFWKTFSSFPSYYLDIVISKFSVDSSSGTLVLARLSEFNWGEFLAGFGSNGGASISFFSFYLLLPGDTFSFSYESKIDGGFANLSMAFLEPSVFIDFLSVLKHLSRRSSPSLCFEDRLKMGVCILDFF